MERAKLTSAQKSEIGLESCKFCFFFERLKQKKG